MNNTKKITLFVLSSFLIFNQNTFCYVSRGFTVGELLKQDLDQLRDQLKDLEQTKLNMPSRYGSIIGSTIDQEMKNIKIAIENKSKSTTSQTPQEIVDQRDASNFSTRFSAASRRASSNSRSRSRSRSTVGRTAAARRR